MNQEQKLDAMKQTEAVDYHSTRWKTTNVNHNVLIESFFSVVDLNVVLRGRRASGISFFVFHLFVGFVLASCSNVFCVSGVFTVKTALIYREFS